MKKKLFYIIVSILLCVSSSLAADESVGEISRIEGQVDITSPGMEARPAALKDQIKAEDIVRTKSRSKAELTLVDGSIIRFAPETRVKIAEYMATDEEVKGIFQVFRGKIQSIIKKKLWDIKKNVEVHTSTAVIGVRGTDFFTYYINGVSGAVFREGSGYGYNLNKPDDVFNIRAGQAIVINAPDQLPVIRPVTSIEMGRHIHDTGMNKRGREGNREGPPPGHEAFKGRQDKNAPPHKNMPVEHVIADALKSREEFKPEKFEFVMDLEKPEAQETGWFYKLDINDKGSSGILISPENNFVSIGDAGAVSPDNIQGFLDRNWNLYVGNTPGTFSSGTESGGAIYVSPIMREDVSLQDSSWQISSLKYAGTYETFKSSTFDNWTMSLNYPEAETRRFFDYEGSKWSGGEIAGKGVSAWVNWDTLASGIGGGEIKGTYDPGSSTWQGTGRWAAMDGSLFSQMQKTQPDTLKSLNIPSIEIGKASLTGTIDNMSVQMNDVTFFSYSTGDAPRIWTTDNISGTFNKLPETGAVVPLNGNGLNAEFEVARWRSNTWGALINSGTGTLSRADNGLTSNIRFNGGAAGTYDTGTFKGTGAGVAAGR